MKRLILLTILAVPLAVSGLRPMLEGPRPAHRIGPRHAHGPEPAGRAADGPEQVVKGYYPKATSQDAEREARRMLDRTITDWLEPAGVPRTWHASDALLDDLVRTEPPEAREEDYGTVYVQTLRLDASDAARERLIEAYERDLAGRRLGGLGVVLAFVLTCLGLLTGYIWTDEATRGYYTNRLRLAALAGAGGAGYALYRFLA